MANLTEADIPELEALLKNESVQEGIAKGACNKGELVIKYVPKAHKGKNYKGIRITVELAENKPEANVSLEDEVLKDAEKLKEVMMSSGLTYVVQEQYPDWFEITKGTRPCIYLKRFSRNGFDNIKEIKRIFKRVGFVIEPVTLTPLHMTMTGFNRNEQAISFNMNPHIFCRSDSNV